MKSRAVILIALMLCGSLAMAKQIEVSVKGMVCAFCAQGITKKFKAEPGVQKVDVSLEKKTVTIDLKDGVDITNEKIKDLLEDSGYTVEKIER